MPCLTGWVGPATIRLTMINGWLLLYQVSRWPMHFENPKAVLQELTARIVAIRDSL